MLALNVDESISVSQVRSAIEIVTAAPDFRALIRGTGRTPDPDAPLTSWLYARWWCGVPLSPVTGPPTVDLRPELEEARRGAAEILPGWVVLACRAGSIVAARYPGSAPDRSGAVVTLRDDAVVGSSRPGLPPRPGDLVDLVAGSSSSSRGDGWWWAHTGAEPVDGTGGVLDRIYLNVGPDTVVDAVARVMAAATGAGLDLSLKCPAATADYGRRDAVVVYHRRTDRAAADLILADLVRELSGLVIDDVPPFTRRVGPGVAVAQDPGGSISYGELRCAQVAAVVVILLQDSGFESIDRADLDRTGRISAAAVRAALLQVGIDPGAPHLLDGVA